MGPTKMRSLCVVDNPCSLTPSRCGSTDQCVFNTNSGLFYCQTNASRCEDGVTCLNGGSCIDQADDGYMCQCREYFTGNHCEYANSCRASNPCQNGGTCYNRQWSDERHAGCQCTDGYFGDKCQHDVSKCHSGYYPCGYGQCVESSQWHYCACHHPELMCVSSQIKSQCWDNTYPSEFTWSTELIN